MNSCGPSAAVPDLLRFPSLLLELLLMVHLPARIYDEKDSDHSKNTCHIHAHVRELACPAVDERLMKLICARVYE